MDFDVRYAYLQFVQGVARLPLPEPEIKKRPNKPSAAVANRHLVDPASDDEA